MKTETSLNEGKKTIQLWTWQTEDIRLTEGTLYYERSSFYQNKAGPDIQNAYKRLFKVLGTDQIHYCFIDAEEAAKPWKNRVIWEIEVPESDVDIVCSSVWCKIIGDKTFGPSSKLWYEWNRKANNQARNSIESRAIRDRMLDAYRESEPLEELWEKLFQPLDQIPNDANAIVKHPVDGSWIRPLPISFSRKCS